MPRIAAARHQQPFLPPRDLFSFNLEKYRDKTFYSVVVFNLAARDNDATARNMSGPERYLKGKWSYLSMLLGLDDPKDTFVCSPWLLTLAGKVYTKRVITFGLSLWLFLLLSRSCFYPPPGRGRELRIMCAAELSFLGSVTSETSRALSESDIIISSISPSVFNLILLDAFHR